MRAKGSKKRNQENNMRLTIQEEKNLNSLTLKEKKEAFKKITTEIVNSKFAYQMIISGPGTGKTTLFEEKIKKWNVQGVDSKKILVTSFINFIIDDLTKSLPKDCSVYTLHKLAKIIIHRYLNAGLNYFKGPITNDFNVAWECDEINISKDIIFLEKTKSDLASVKSSLEVYFQTLSSTKKPSFIDAYLKLATFYDLVTFEDSIVRAYKVLLTERGVLDYERVIVDEYQDFNVTEQKLVKKLFEFAKGGIIAGDDDQSIYSSRQAHPDSINSLIDDETWEKKTIPFCGRCKSEYIVNSSIEICRRQRNNNRIDKSLLPIENNNKKVKVITLKSSTSNSKNKNKHFLAEAEYIAKKIDPKYLSSWEENYPAYLILGKTNSHLKRISDVLNEKLGIQIGMKEPSIYGDVEVQILFSYLQLMKNSGSNVAYRRLVGIFFKSEEKRIFLDAWTNNGFNRLGNNRKIKKIQNNLQAAKEKIKKLSKEGVSIEKILWEIATILKLSPNNQFLKKYIDSIKNLASIEKIIMQTEEFVIDERERERKSILSYPVQCLTIWGSKGLKAETVFILGLEEGYLPKSNNNFDDEEVRLMYVGMTRAIKELSLIHCSRRDDGVHSSFGGTNGFKRRSIFLDWIPNIYMEQESYSKKDLV